MAAVPQQVNKQALKSLVPLNGLSQAHFDELVNKSEVKELASGRFLFREGDRDGLTYFLLAGEIALMQGRDIKQTVQAGSDEASHPIGHTQPRQWAAKAQGRISVLAVDSGLLDVLLAWDQANSYEVTDIQAEDDEDWMTRMLSSDLFQRLPANNIQQLLMRMEEVSVEAGSRVVSQDEPGDFYYIVKQGAADVTRKPSSQSKPVKIAQLRAGDSFGEEALLSGGPRNADVTMSTDGVLMRLAKADFDALLREPLIEHIDYQQACQQAAQGAQWLDVRLPGEYQNGHLPGSTNLALAAVRDATTELVPGHRYIVCCDTGTRSVGAAFLLSQRGFDAVVLRGGLNGVPHEELRRAEFDSDAAAGAEILDFNGRADDQRPVAAQTEAARAQAQAIIREAKQQADAMRTELKAAQEQVNERLQRIADLEQAISAKAKELRALHRSFEQAEAAQEDVQRLGTELARAQAQLQEQRAQMEQARGEHAEREQELLLLREQAQEQQAELQRLQDEGRQGVEAHAALTAQLEQLHQQREALERDSSQRLQALEAERDQVRAALEERERALTAAAGEMEKLQLQHKSGAEASARLQEREQAFEQLQDELRSAGEAQAALQAELEQARSEIESQRNTLAQHVDELASRAEVNQHAEQRIRELETAQARSADADAERIQELEGRLAASDKVLAEREAALQALNDELERLRGVQNEADAELTRRQADWDAARAALDGQVEALQARERALAETVQHLEQEREASASDLQQRITVLESQLHQRTADLEQRQQALVSLEEQMQGAREAQTEVERQGAEREQQLQSRIDELQQLLEQRSADLADQQASAVERDAALSALRADHGELQTQLQQAQEQAARLDQEIEQLRSGRTDTEQQLQARIDELQAELDKRSDAIAQQDAERSRIEQELETLGRQRDELQAQLEAREQAWSSERSELEQRAGAVEAALQQQLTDQRSEAQAELDHLRGDLARLRTDHEDLEQVLAQARQDQTRKADELRELQAERKKLKQQVAELESWMVRAERKRDDHERQLEEKEQSLAELRQQLEEARREANVARERSTALQKQLDNSDRQLDEHSEQLRDEAAASRAEVCSLQERLEAAQRDAEQAEQRRGVLEAEREALNERVDALRRELEQAQVQYRDSAQEAGREREELELHLEAMEQDKTKARERMEAAVAAQRDAEAALRTAEREAGQLRQQMQAQQAALAQAQATAEQAGATGLGNGADAMAEVASIRELADQELRAAAAEIARLQGELEESRYQVRHMETEVALLRDLDGSADQAPGPSADVQTQLDQRLAQHQQESERALDSLRAQNRALQEELQRLQGQSVGAVPSLRANEPPVRVSARRGADSELDRPLPGGPVARPPAAKWPLVLGLLLALAGGGWGYWQTLHGGRPEASSPASTAGAAAQPGSPQPAAHTPNRPQAPARSRADEDSAAESAAGSAAAAPMRPGRTYQDFLDDGGMGPVMVQLPGGTFTMGSPQTAPYFDERPPRTVQLAPFSMAKYEITFEEYDRFARVTGRDLPGDSGWGRGQRPVIGVSWDDAHAYAQWLSAASGHRYRLPSEAEWEYAARAGTDTFYWWGNQPQPDKANCFDCAGEWSGATTAPVGSMAANPMGLYDMTGNAMEWVQDCYRDSYQGAPANGGAVEFAGCDKRVARGGSYRTVMENLRSARRDQYDPQTRLDQIGFRLVREP